MKTFDFNTGPAPQTIIGFYYLEKGKDETGLNSG